MILRFQVRHVPECLTKIWQWSSKACKLLCLSVMINYHPV